MSAASIPFLLETEAKERPDAVAIASLSRPPLSYAAFAAATRRVAEGLSRQGIGPGDRVALLLPNRAEAAILLLALARLSAIAVPLDPRFGVEDIAALLSRARVSAVATHWGHGEAVLPDRLAAALPDVRAPLRFIVGLDAGGVESLAGPPVLRWQSLDAMPEREDDDAQAEAAWLALPATGGRLALHSQQAVASHARAVAEQLGLEAGRSAVLPALPVATPTGMAAMMAALLSGARLLCQEEDGAAAADALARAHGATHLLGWPAVLAALAPLAARRPYGALGLVGCSGAVPAELALPMRQVWGTAETQGLFAIADGGTLLPVAPAELRMGTGLEIRSPSLLTGWLGEEAGEGLPDGFLATGLPATLEGGGFTLGEPLADAPFWLDDLCVQPGDAARFLSRQPGVEAVAITASPPAGALVGFLRPVAEAALDTGALTALCRQALAPARVPVRLAVVEQLPEPPALANAAAALLAAEA
ncbi:AMP-binding protein [Roseomonas aerophila]|uniref:AMP-binding protein n=1 Tax=Teichococcus aerophilus TaxID=1224513 RepID=A0ABR7RR11_9PROT|nr:AMP-binding protein [Pseudoroseomonas aerophila]MBC9209046.1 AMP-binding protein [Pseudoroseomonas aerophila]